MLKIAPILPARRLIIRKLSYKKDILSTKKAPYEEGAFSVCIGNKGVCLNPLQEEVSSQILFGSECGV